MAWMDPAACPPVIAHVVLVNDPLTKRRVGAQPHL